MREMNGLYQIDSVIMICTKFFEGLMLRFGSVQTVGQKYSMKVREKLKHTMI